MIPEFLVILTNCISDYWIVPPQKNGANLPPTGQFALQNKLDLALWAFRPQKFLKLPGTIGFNILTQWLNVGYFQYIRLQGKFKYFTNNINDISIFISYNKVHPDMWHNQLYSIHTHIYISQYVILLSTISHFYLGFPSRPAPVSLCNWLLISTSQDGKVTGRKWITNAEQKWPRQWTPWFPALWGRPCKVAAKRSSDVIYIYKSKRKPHISWDRRKI